MTSLPYAQAFDLCGEECAAPPPRPQLTLVGRRQRLKDRSERLADIVETQILPRLLVAHAPRRSELADESAISEELVERFAQYALSVPHESLLAVVGGLLGQGMSTESIYLDLLAPAARRIGDYWNEDRASYVDVTIALGRLQQVVRELSIHGSPEIEAAHGSRAALFAPAPGEQHTFGLVIIEEFFRRSGWRTWTELSGDAAEIQAAASAHHFDLFGVTCSGPEWLDKIKPLIGAVRVASRNRSIRVLVGGRLFLEQPELAAEVGADGMAADARDAVLQAESAVRRLATC